MGLTGVIARYADAWNDHDAVACAACFAHDGYRIWCVQATSMHAAGPEGYPRFDGRPAIATAIAGFMASVPDLRLEVAALSEGSDERVWTEWRVTGTHAEDWGDWWARGEPVQILGVSIFRVGAGVILGERVYWDSLSTTRSPAAPLSG
jgi:hypothetical protein